MRQDLAALNKQEMVLWDSWGPEESEHLSDEYVRLLDHVAARMIDREITVSELRELYALDEFQVPSVVTSYSPAASAPLRVPVNA
jgi:hypothetical protein